MNGEDARCVHGADVVEKVCFVQEEINKPAYEDQAGHAGLLATK